MKIPVVSRLRWLPALAALALMTACSTGTRLAYNNLDKLVSWQLSDYVELDASQKASFQSGFKSLWDWHRGTQLPVYARDLRSIATSFEQGTPSAAALEADFALVEAHAKRLGDRAKPLIEPLIPTLSDAQVEHLLKRQREDIDKEERKHADETPAQRRKRFQKTVSERFNRWLGELNEAQIAFADRWWDEGLASLPTAAQRHQARLDELQQSADLLAARHAPDFQTRLDRAWNPEDDEAKKASSAGVAEAAEAKRNRQLTIGIVQRSDAKQRQHLHDWLIELAEDCEALSATAAASDTRAQP